MVLTLSDISENPSLLTQVIPGSKRAAFVLRPLESSDLTKLTAFLECLSQETRRFCTYPGYDRATAQEFCDAINRYDKLRLVVEEAALRQMIGLLEYSFAIPEGDLTRFAIYKVELNAITDCRFGPCLSDDYQNKGVGSVVFPYISNVARLFGKSRIILWGGVLAENQRAIRYYEKNGFKLLGAFINRDNLQCLDMILNL